MKNLTRMRLPELIKSASFCLLLFFGNLTNVSSQNSFSSKFEKIIFGCYAKDIKEFEDFAKRAKQSGATHINLSNEDLPFSRWEYDVPDDPYPSWVITNMGLLKIATPEALKSYLPQDYAEKVLSILEERCKVLRKYGLKAAFKTFEPQMLPEKVYEDHPLWRGPRVDHPSRSRTARWAPDIDNSEVLQLYRESFAILLKRCPEIEILSLTTNDSGTGLSWSGGLYSGSTGNTFNKMRRTDERIFSFFSVFIETAKTAGVKMEVDFYGTREDFPEKIAKSLIEGMAIENFEGPEGRAFKSEVGFVMDFYQLLYPVVGIPDPLKFIEELELANKSTAKRVYVLFGDRFNKELYFEIYDKFKVSPSNDIITRLVFLKNLADSKVGEQGSDQLFNLWMALRDVRSSLIIGNLGGTGGSVFYLGAVQERWLTRPFVPFPEELSPQDRNYYRKFQFQAKSEEEANDMANMQANLTYSGWSGRSFMLRLMSSVKIPVSQAKIANTNLLKLNISPEQKKEFQLLDLRLQALGILCNNAENAISYQAQIDKAKASGYKPEVKTDAGKPSSWERSLILETARREIDNTSLLIQLLESSGSEIFDLAPSKELEDIRRLGPDFKIQLKKKLKIMNEHWLDYNRIYAVPNL
jgi:hypothetical protein